MAAVAAAGSSSDAGKVINEGQQRWSSGAFLFLLPLTVIQILILSVRRIKGKPMVNLQLTYTLDTVNNLLSFHLPFENLVVVVVGGGFSFAKHWYSRCCTRPTPDKYHCISVPRTYRCLRMRSFINGRKRISLARAFIVQRAREEQKKERRTLARTREREGVVDEHTYAHTHTC